MSKFARQQQSSPPEGWDYVEPILTALENELRDKVNEPHEGLRKVESGWPVYQINWQRTRYIYDLYYTYGRISRQIYDYCIDNKLIDAALIAKWKKPGYERLCSTSAINPQNSKFGTVSICRVPRSALDSQEVEDQTTGCRGCASGPTTKNIFGNKYGQYLAQIQIAREDREERKRKRALEDWDDEAKDKATSEDSTDSRFVVGAADGSAGTNARSLFWAADESEVERAAAVAARLANAGPPGGEGGRQKYEPPGKRSRPSKSVV